MASIRLVAAGDIMPLRDPRPDPSAFPWRLIRSADLAFGNLECAVTDGGYRQDKIIALRAPAGLAPAISGMGFRALSLANNHAVDYGTEGLFDTLRLVGEQGVALTGAGANLSAALSPAVVEAGSRTVACFGLCCTLPTGSAAAADRPGVAPIRIRQTIEVDPAAAEEQPGTAPYVHTSMHEADLAQALAAIRRARAEGHLVAVAIHWGVPPIWMAPFQGLYADYQAPLGHALVDAGADLIIGHHPHVIHGLEIYNGAPIFYSLGNFLFSPKGSAYPPYSIGRPIPPWKGEFKSEAMLESVLPVLEYNSRGLAAVEIHPVRLDSVYAEPAEPEPATALAILDRFSRMSEALGTRCTVDPERRVARIEPKGDTL